MDIYCINKCCDRTHYINDFKCYFQLMVLLLLQGDFNEALDLFDTKVIMLKEW